MRMFEITKIVSGLATYAGRDSCIRVVSYFALFLYGLLNTIELKKFKDNFNQNPTTSASQSFVLNFLLGVLSIETIESLAYSCLIISKQFALCRLINRFFDDVPAIYNLYKHYRESYATPSTTTDKLDHNNNRAQGKPHPKTKNLHPYVKWLTSVNLIFWVLYNPFEHLGWLAELKIINANDQLWYFYTNLAWAGGLFTSVLLNARLVYLYYTQSNTKAKREDDAKYDSSQIISHSEMRQSLLIAFRDFLDWCIAVHFMPEGFLWSAKLYHYQVGLIGTVSSLCRVHTYVVNRQE